jgi:hypothetical protein
MAFLVSQHYHNLKIINLVTKMTKLKLFVNCPYLNHKILLFFYKSDRKLFYNRPDYNFIEHIMAHKIMLDLYHKSKF